MWALDWLYLESPWEGDLKDEFKMCGWLDNDENHKNADCLCNFEEDMGNTFNGLNVNRKSAEMGSPNQLFLSRAQGRSHSYEEQRRLLFLQKLSKNVT